MTIKDDSDRHNLYLQKLAAGLYNSAVFPSLEAARLAVRSMLLDAEELRTIADVKKIQARITREVNTTYGAGWDEATLGLEEAAYYEAEWQVNAIEQYTADNLIVPADKRIKSWIDNSVMSLTSGQRVSSGVWADFVRGSKASVARAYNGAVIQGYQDGLTVNQIATNIKNTTDGLLKREAETLARTGMSHYANGARDAMAAANKDILYARVFSATFDNRTTLICRSLDGNVYLIEDTKYPRFPIHYGERSSYYFVTDESEIGQGKKSAVGGKTDGSDINPRRKLIYRGKRDKDLFKPGQIDAGTTQDAWLRNQPRWFVESSLGKDKAKLFLDGGMKIEKFVDMQGSPINLDRLRELDSAAFKRAGL